MTKAIFLDRDGTINEETHYLYRIEDFIFMPRVVDALKKIQQAGFLLIIITNQSGIGRGYYTEEDFRTLNSWMVNALKEQGVFIRDVYYCPHIPDAAVQQYRKDCECRKPKLGMFRQAIVDYNIDLSKSYAIGDKIRDCAICENTECRGFLVGCNETPDIIEEVKQGKRKGVSYAIDLWDCVEKILQKTRV